MCIHNNNIHIHMYTYREIYVFPVSCSHRQIEDLEVAPQPVDSFTKKLDVQAQVLNISQSDIK